MTKVTRRPLHHWGSTLSTWAHTHVHTCARTPTRTRTCTRTHAHGQAHARALLAGSLRWRLGTPWRGAEGHAPEKK